jgi:hypothetical protein
VTFSRRLAKSATKIMWRKKILIGHAGLISQTGEARSGGAVVKEESNNQDVSLLSTSAKMMTKTSLLTKRLKNETKS